MTRITLTAAALACSLLTAQRALAATEEAEFRQFGPKPADAPRKYFDQEHDAGWAWDALAELSGSRPPADASPGQLAELTAQQLAALPEYGERSVARVEPIPAWVLEGYQRFSPATLSRSRYLAGVLDGSQQAEADLAALYGYWSLYDAEWFALSRRPGFKAWLSAVALTYPPDWLRLQDESAASLHGRLVAPRQTPDEPFREIDNWIANFRKPIESGELGAFVKPKVRDALVAELLVSAGLEGDDRMFEQRAYRAGAPARLGLSDREFFLLAALTLEFFQELYQADPQQRRPLHFRDYFVEAFRGTP